MIDHDDTAPAAVAGPPRSHQRLRMRPPRPAPTRPLRKTPFPA
ncbi:hypothetical protein N177_2638 [Lutibaculum baratangense AMV1]|uniref:Uncharacterized protein n=1 Tax=Lutibaculum baratangense AMV1 TaxID=631454 RepID=V4RFM5_9HYPH|nr:hypothetical protein N177_2638 [Lutibaculum baratangense AMV1]